MSRRNVWPRNRRRVHKMMKRLVKWFKPHSKYWGKVQCIECELNRDCDKHGVQP